MRVISVVVIKEGVVNDIESFAIYEEQLSEEVVEKAEAMFIKKAKELGYDGEDDDDLCNDGYYMIDNASVCICWSHGV